MPQEHVVGLSMVICILMYLCGISEGASIVDIVGVIYQVFRKYYVNLIRWIENQDANESFL